MGQNYSFAPLIATRVLQEQLHDLGHGLRDLMEYRKGSQSRLHDWVHNSNY